MGSKAEGDGGGDVLMVQRLLLFVGCVLLTFAILFL